MRPHLNGDSMKTAWSSSMALWLAVLCIVSPYLASLVSQTSTVQRVAVAIVIYLIVSAQSQREGIRRFQVPQHDSTSRSVRSPPAEMKHTDSKTERYRPTPSVAKRSLVLPAEAASTEDGTISHTVARVRSEQCPQLMDACYLDAAAAPPYPSGLVRAVADELSIQLLSNPHSKSPSAISTADQIASIRLRVMRELFGIQDTHNWNLVFTSGTTASLKLVGDSFDWATLSRTLRGKTGFSYLLESHTSAVGIRDLAARAGVASSSFTDGDDVVHVGREGLVVLPLQCNATGKRYADLMKRICRSKGEHALVMVDAASYLSSSQRLDLSRLSADEMPDLVAFSFYKIFGYPTGLGGLLVKASAVPRLSSKTYFGGGTVDSILAESRWTKPRKDLEARFEDGTVNIHGILAVNKALEYYRETFGPWDQRGAYLSELRTKLVRAMEGLMHGNGNPVVRLYPGSDAGGDFGPIVNLNILTATGSIVPPQEVDRLASISNIHLRMGRHCNPGFVTSQLGVTPGRLKQEYADGVGCDDAGDSALEGTSIASASLRASLCLLNTDEDLERLVGFIARFFLSSMPTSQHSMVRSLRDNVATQAKFELAGITVYPIKSCAGQALDSNQAWTLTRHGLEHDREWIVMNLANGKALSQKRFPKMALIRPRIDLVNRTMTIFVAGTAQAMTIALEDESQYVDDDAQVKKAEVCGVEVRPRAHKSEALRSMLTELLGVSCTLARQATDVSRHSKLDAGSEKIPLIFSNESPFLMINSASVDKVSEWVRQDSACSPFASGLEEVASDSGYSSASHRSQLQDEKSSLVQAASFRANFLISVSKPEMDSEAFAEDGFSRIVLDGKHVFGVLGECRRCQMVCVDQKTGEVKPQTLKTLAKHRRNARGRIIFGSHLAWLPSLSPSKTFSERDVDATPAKVWVGMEVVAS